MRRAAALTAEPIRSYPHDPDAFTQGLLVRDGRLFESTGPDGRSTIREVRLEDGAVLRGIGLPASIWSEGIVDWKDELISLTWRSGAAFRWALGSFRPLGAFRYAGEGWGLTRDDRDLIMSDGTPVLRFLDPETFAVRRRVTVTEDDRPLHHLNDLQWVKGEILANVFMSDTIVRIDPAFGRVVGRIDCAGLAADSGRRDARDVLNGIAYDAAADRLFVTGKNWPRLYEIRRTWGDEADGRSAGGAAGQRGRSSSLPPSCSPC